MRALIRICQAVVIATVLSAFLLASPANAIMLVGFGGYTDNFNRANETPIGGNWTTRNNGGTRVNLSSNAVVSDNIAHNAYAFRNSESYASNQYSQIRLASTVSTNYVGGPAVRASCDNTCAVWWNGYFLAVGSTSILQVYVMYGSGGVLEQIGTNISGTFAQNDTIKLSITGNVLSIYQNGSLLTTRTDTNNRISSGGAAGFYIDTAAGTILDDWAGGNN